MEKNDSRNEPVGLPGAKTVADSRQESDLNLNMAKARTCPKCGKEGRIVSNYAGVNGHCGPCKIHWPVTNSALRPEVPSSLPRGLSKQTAVEPDWSVAFEGDT